MEVSGPGQSNKCLVYWRLTKPLSLDTWYRMAMVVLGCVGVGGRVVMGGLWPTEVSLD